MLRAFARDGSGVIAIKFGLLVLPIVLFGGIAIDYTRALNAQRRLNSAVDSTAIAAANFASDPSIPSGELETRAQAFFKTNYPDQEATVSLVNNGNRVTVTGAKTVLTTLMRAGGVEKFDLSARAVATKSNPVDAEIVLVLDYSGSMGSNGKYQTMRDAAINMIQKLSTPAGGAGSQTIANVKIGLVPFSEFVYTDMDTTYIRDIHPDKHGAQVRACLDSRRSPFATQDSTPIAALNDTKWPAPGMPDPWRLAGALPSSDVNTLGTGDEVCTTTRRKTEEECRAELISRYGTYNDDQIENCTHQTVTEQTLISQSDQCQKTYTTTEKTTQTNEALATDFASVSPKCAVYRDRSIITMPLTTDYAALIAQLSAMTPVRLTNIALGLEMGWHVISSNEPFIDGTAYGNRTVKKFVVLLTDGAQTVGGWGPGNSFSIGQADRNTEALCAAIKAKDVTMITVAFDLNDAATKNRLQNCASGPNFFFDAATNTDLVTAFEDITAQLFVPVHLVE